MSIPSGAAAGFRCSARINQGVSQSGKNADPNIQHSLYPIDKGLSQVVRFRVLTGRCEEGHLSAGAQWTM
jgi:hypothetical protein